MIESIGLSPDLDRVFDNTENLFILKWLIDLMQTSKKKLFYCFIEFKQGFDTVWRAGLWKNWYEKISQESALSWFSVSNEGSTAFFDCNFGVQLGDNLSPILFTFYLNEPESFLSTRQVNGVECDVVIDEIHIYFKVLILLYADDTVLFSDNSDDLQ